MSKLRDTDALRRGYKTLTGEIDQLLLGASPDRLDHGLNLEDREILELAYRLTDAQLAERSHIRESLRERLVSQVENRQEMNRKMESERVVKKQSSNWRVILIIAVTLVMLALIAGAVAVLFINSSEPAAPVSMEVSVDGYADDAPPMTNGYRVFPVYDIQDVAFGEVIRLEQMVVRFEPYNSSPDVDSIILIWEAIGPVPPGRYAVVVEAIDLEDGESLSDQTVEVSLPTESGTSLATEHDINRYGGYVLYRMSVFDRENGERLLMGNGEEYMELRTVPSSIVPSVPGGSGELPTAPPPAVITATPFMAGPTTTP